MNHGLHLGRLVLVIFLIIIALDIDSFLTEVVTVFYMKGNFIGTYNECHGFA